ncbi:hypothetical protein Tco_0798861 [Tanacetum coccineum]
MPAIEVPQNLEYRGGQLNAAHVLEVENFTNWPMASLTPPLQSCCQNMLQGGKPFLKKLTASRDEDWNTINREPKPTLEDEFKDLHLNRSPSSRSNL